MNRPLPRAAQPGQPQLTHEQLKQAQAAATEQIKMVRVFKDLVRSEGWKQYVDLLNRKLNAEMTGYLAPLNPLAIQGQLVGDGLLMMARQEYLKGTVNGLVIARDIVPATIEQTKGLVDDETEASAEEKDQ